ncbi:hypothetical protein [Actinoallomurus sp. NPDC052274]|uniref:hypothetical protein n=1 Tax=Actinoallomurus sp. NPDC052274 TaxID=3155420 RepID=UPI003430F2F0
MGYLRGFLPWITFDAVSLFGSQRAALVALVMTTYFLVKDRRAGVAADAQILDFGTIAYFGMLTAVAFADPHSPLLNYESGLSSMWLALIAGVSLLVRQPFTLGIAKRRTPPEIWRTPRFRHTSTVIARVWAISFTFGAAATLVCEATGTSQVIRAVIQVLAFGVPATFTHQYVKKVRARKAAPVATTESVPVAGE